MLKLHINYLKLSSFINANHFREIILQSAKELEYFPKRYPLFLVPEISNKKYRKMVVDKRYLLLYEVIGESVWINLILDCRQNYKWFLKE